MTNYKTNWLTNELWSSTSMMTSNDIIQITLFMKALIKTETKIHRLEFKFFKYIMNVQGKTIYSKTENT